MVNEQKRDALVRLDRYFHDCEMVLKDLRHDEARKEMSLPIIAADPSVSTEKRLMFPFIRKTVVLKKWLLLIHDVERVDVEWEPDWKNARNVGLGRVTIPSQSKIVIEGHYAVTVVVTVSEISADLKMTDEIVRTETNTRIAFRSK